MSNSADVLAGRVFYQDTAQVAVVREKPVKYLENVWGQSIRSDPKFMSYDMNERLHPKNFSRVRDRYVGGALPYRTTPKLIFNRNDRMIPEDVHVSTVCLKEERYAHGPWYKTYFPPVDLWPVPPTSGDITKDPKFLQDYTRNFTKNHKKIW